MSPHYLCFLGFLAMVASHEPPKGCCVPNTWRAVMTNTSQINPDMIRYAEVFFDYTLKKEAQIHYGMKPGQSRQLMYKILVDYNMGTMYIIAGEKCMHQKTFTTMFPSCLPDDATYIGSSYVGGPKTKVEYDSWRYVANNITITIGVERHTCVPIIEGIKGSGEYAIDATLFFSGFESPLKDKCVFDIPDSCKTN